jgi:hypothetical protein
MFNGFGASKKQPRSAQEQWKTSHANLKAKKLASG